MKTNKNLAVISARKNKLSNGCKISKKMILAAFTAAIMCCICCAAVFATSGDVNSKEFVSKAGTVLKSVIILIGAGLGVWGVVNLLEGYGNDNAGAKSQGMKQLMAGLGLIVLAMALIPVLVGMMDGQT